MQRNKGFTLIEMLIAMTLLSVMVVLLFSSLNIAAESWNAGEGKIIEVNKKAVVYQFFKRHLTTIRPALAEAKQDNAGAPVAGNEMVDTNNGMGGAQLLFRGQHQAMRFVGALPAASARKGLQVFEIAAGRAEPSTIMVTLSPYQKTEPGESKPEVLLEHVKDFAFSYFGKKDNVSEAVWQDEWTSFDHLPQLIKVGIALEDGSYWPDMVFRLKITGLAAVEAIAADAIDNSDATLSQ
ncbi:MAG: prepilin-type N-terminal cleavage/methylation domain-containing protein [Methylomonas sp.]